MVLKLSLEFEEMVAWTRRRELDAQVAALGAETRARHKAGKVSAAARKARLWSPLAKKAMLAAAVVRKSEGGEELITDEPRIDTELSLHWPPFFARKQLDEEFQDMVLRHKATPVGDIGNALPGLADMQRFLKKTSDSAPGPGGIPYSGW